MDGAIVGRHHLRKLIADAIQDVVTEQAPAARQLLQDEIWRRVHRRTNAVDFREHTRQAGTRDLVALLDDRRGAVKRRQPDAVRHDLIAVLSMVPVWMLLVGGDVAFAGIDRQKERVRGRQGAQLRRVPPRQRAIARESSHQLVACFKGSGAQLRLQEPPQHSRMALDQIDGGQQRRPVQLPAEAQLQVVRLRQLVEVERPVQRQAAPATGRPHRKHRRVVRILVEATSEDRDAHCQRRKLIRRRNAVERIGQLLRLRAAKTVPAVFDDLCPGRRLAHPVRCGGIGKQGANAPVHIGVIRDGGVRRVVDRQGDQPFDT